TTLRPTGATARFPGGVSSPRPRPGTDQVAIPAADTVFLYQPPRPRGTLLNPGNPRWVRAVAVSPDGARAAVSAGGRVDLFDPRTGKKFDALRVRHEAIALRFDPVHGRLLRGSRQDLEATTLPDRKVVRA